MVRKNVPRVLWDFGAIWVSTTMRLTARHAGKLQGRTRLERATGETPDISENLDFGFYDLVWYRENAGLGEEKIGRWLGVSKNYGSQMSYWILTSSGYNV